ncbi:hypothetical protein KR032_006626, partial [Drosophila birchii]
FAAVQGSSELGLIEHNRLRRLHGVPPVKLSEELTLRAIEYAKVRSYIITMILCKPFDTQVLAAHQNLVHSKSDGLYGENLCIRTRDPEKCVQYWYNEHIFYDYSSPRFSFETGHFTQVIWVGTKEIGWGEAKDSYGTYYVVCMYIPSGNIRGEFAKNIPMPTS